MMDISADKILSWDIEKHVETSCFGPFIFQVGVDQRETAMLLQRVADAQVESRRAVLPLPS
jgi:hypothetical protein